MPISARFSTPAKTLSANLPAESTLDRRQFLLAASIAIPGVSFLTACAQPAVTEPPFSLGVASGDVTAAEVALWTRLAPHPLRPDGGMAPVDVAVDWELASDAGFSRLVASGRAAAVPELAHSVHVTVPGLEPARPYWYRFRALGFESIVGRTRTLPTGPTTDVRFATASCQHYEQGHFVAYRAMLEDQPDFVLHLGDYIYEVARGGPRQHERPHTPETLGDYRVRHALYKTDPSLQAAHAALPFFQMLDNHDAAAEAPATPEPIARRASAYQAWFEHTPMREVPSGFGRLNVARGIDLGNLARIDLVDTRQYRAPQGVCDGGDPNFGFGIYRPRCAELDAPGRTMLGAGQLKRLQQRLQADDRTWTVLASTVLFSNFGLTHDGQEYVYEAGWDAYPEDRRAVVDAWRSGTANRVVLSADLHSNWAVDVPGAATQRNLGDEIVAAEFLCTSISSGWPEPLDRPLRDNLEANSHVRDYNSDHRGYQLHQVTSDQWLVQARTIGAEAVRTGAFEAGSASTTGRFVVEAGRPGVSVD